MFRLRSIIRARAGKKVLLVGSALVATAVPANAYSCQNETLEVTCDASKCEASGGFTPMRLSLDSRGRRLSLCAYSGCFEGRPTKISETSRYLHVSGSFRFSGMPRDSWDIAVTVDKQKGYAVMMGGGFVNPMICAKVGANGFKMGVSFASGRPYALWKSEQVGGIDLALDRLQRQKVRTPIGLLEIC
jgi:hypothetical protein